MADGYIIQKAVEPGKVVKDRRLTLEQYGRFFYAQKKYDGCCAVIDTTNRLGWSRTGEPLLSMNAQIEALSDCMGPGFYVIAEAWAPGVEFSVISGAFRKKSEQRPWLVFVVNDVIRQAEWDAGVANTVGWYARFCRYAGKFSGDAALPAHPMHFAAATYRPGEYGCPQALCNVLVDEGGYDGLILRDANGAWVKGSLGTSGEIVKIKRVLSFDLRVTDVMEGLGEKTGRAVYTIAVDFRGKRLEVGSGIPHDKARVPKIGQIVEVCAMDYSSDGLLREPRFKGVRHDKLQPDQ